jgi:hypothetical protein
MNTASPTQPPRSGFNFREPARLKIFPIIGTLCPQNFQSLENPLIAELHFATGAG